MTIGVLLTTRNRKEKTLTCIESLKRQRLPADVSLEVFLTDDGSTDGTVDAVRQAYPSANIFKSDGSLFWAGGMRNSWTHALKEDLDFYLLLNDDTTLTADAIAVLIQGCRHEGLKASVC